MPTAVLHRTLSPCPLWIASDLLCSQVLYYQHIPIPCVQMAFYPDGKSIHNQHNSNLCANPKLAAAGASCCTPGNLNPSSSREYNPSEHCEVKWELVTHSKMVERCSAASLSVCKGFTRQGLPTEVKPAFNNCPPRAPLEFGWSPGSLPVFPSLPGCSFSEIPHYLAVFQVSGESAQQQTVDHQILAAMAIPPGRSLPGEAFTIGQGTDPHPT